MPSILIVDSEIYIINMLEIYLEQQKYKVSKSYKATDEVDAFDFALINVKSDNGMEEVVFAQKLVKANNEIKLIFMSGIHTHCLIPNEWILRKPFRFSELDEKLK